MDAFSNQFLLKLFSSKNNAVRTFEEDGYSAIVLL